MLPRRRPGLRRQAPIGSYGATSDGHVPTRTVRGRVPNGRYTGEREAHFQYHVASITHAFGDGGRAV